MAVNLQPVPEFTLDADLGASLATRWRLWLQDFDTFILASGIQAAKQKKALLLYQAGPRIREIFAQLPGTGDENDFELAKQRLSEYFEPQKNKRYEVYRFRETKQGDQETLDSFHTRLRNMAKTCDFADETFEVEEQIIIGGRSSKIRRRALRDPAYSLNDMLLDGRRDESSAYQAKSIEANKPDIENTHRIHTSQSTSNKNCGHCGGKMPHTGQCPARGKTCRKCNKQNHFAAVCRSSKPASTQARKSQSNARNNSRFVRPLQHESDTSDDEYMYAVNKKNNTSKESPKVNVNVCGYQFSMIVDTGSTINVLDKNTFEKIKNKGIKLQPTKTKAFPFNTEKPVEFEGKFESLIQTKSRYAVATFFVLKQENAGCLLSASTAQEMGIITLKLNKLDTEQTQGNKQRPIINHTDPQIQEILQKYNETFEGIGKLNNYEVQLNIDETAIPQAQPQRRVPFHIRQKVKAAAKELERENIIEPVPDDSPSQWVSPIVAVPKTTVFVYA